MPVSASIPDLLRIPLVTSSKPASTPPVAKAFATNVPVLIDGSLPNSSSNLPPALEAPRAIIPPTPVEAATIEGRDSKAAPTALCPASK